MENANTQVCSPKILCERKLLESYYGNGNRKQREREAKWRKERERGLKKILNIGFPGALKIDWEAKEQEREREAKWRKEREREGTGTGI